MDFLKKHYEKLILSLVLLALAAVAVLLFVQVGSFREELDKQLEGRTAGKKKEFKTADLTASQTALQRLSGNVAVPLGSEHFVFNPPRWKKNPSGEIIPDTSKSTQGPAGISGLITTPLNLTIDFVRVAGTAESPRYEFLVGREFEKKANQRGNLTASAHVGEGIKLPNQKTDLFRIVEVKGSPLEPTEAVIQFTSGGDRVSVFPRKPYVKVMSYAAQFLYGAEKSVRKNVRVDDTLNLSGTSYKVVAVGKDELVVAAPNLSRTAIKTALAANP